MFFLTDEVLRLVQIVAIVMAIGVFVDTTRTTKSTNIQQSEAIEDIRIRQARSEENALRTAEILSMMEARLKNHEIDDAASNESARRTTEIVNGMILSGKMK
jgi:hypothetical protein